MNIIPLFDRILVERIKAKSVSGIILPESIAEKSMQGIVLAIGSGKMLKGVLQPITVKVGDIVLFTKFSGTEIIYNNKDLIMLREDDILGIIK